MNAPNRLNTLSRWMTLLAAILLPAVMLQPIWRIVLTAPQYPEGLVLQIWANRLNGDVEIINGLNHYIGMRTLHTEDFIEFKILPYLIISLSVLALLVIIINRRFLLHVYAVVFILVSLISLADFYRWTYDYGHHLDPTAPIQVPGMSYQPPLIGYKTLLNFTALSLPDVGGYLYILCGMLIVGAAIREYLIRRKQPIPETAAAALLLLYMTSCSPQPRPINYGFDQCSACRMTIMDERFAGELVTTTGKIYTFDDPLCVVDFLRNGLPANEQVHAVYFTDFAGKHHLEMAEKGVFLKSDAFRSPMNGNIAFLTDPDTARLLQQRFGAVKIDWNEWLHR